MGRLSESRFGKLQLKRTQLDLGHKKVKKNKGGLGGRVSREKLSDTRRTRNEEAELEGLHFQKTGLMGDKQEND